MTPQSWIRLKELFGQAFDMDPVQREAFLERLTAREPAIAAELKVLLEEAHTSDSDSDSLGSTSIREFVASLGAATPEQLGSYRILREVGRGGSSIVFHAVRGTGEQPADVAIKVFRFADWDEARKRQFSTERHILSQLNHPHIARMFSWGTTPIGFPFLVMELVEGQTLDVFCAQQSLSIRDRLALFDQVLQAVAFAHGNSIIHRDLKPANILVTRDGQIKLLDFGISKLFESDPDATRTLERRFTPAYASPEQIRGSATGQASDIYSLAVILYELLTRQLPYHGRQKNANELSLAVMAKPPVPPSQISPGITKEFDQVILKALDKSPANRWSSVEEFADRLNQLSWDESAAGKTPSRGHYGRKNAAICAGAAGVLLMLVWWYSQRTAGGRLYFTDAYPVTPAAEFAAYPTLSRDANQIAYASDRESDGPLHIWLQKKIGEPPVRLSSGTANDSDPSFSADGQFVAFHSERNPKGVYLAPVTGGPEQFLAPFGQSPRFSPVDHTLIYWIADPHTRFGSVWKIGLDRPLEPSHLAANFEDAHNPIWTPDGRSVLLWGTRRSANGPGDSYDLWVVPEDGSPAIKTGVVPMLARNHIEPRLLTLRSTSLNWLDHGILLAASQNGTTGLWVIPISRRTWKITGDPYPFGGNQQQGNQGQILHPAVSRSTLTFTRTKDDLQVWCLPVNPETAETRGPPVPLTKGPFQHLMPSVSTDGGVMMFLGGNGNQMTACTRDADTGRERPLPGPPIQTNRIKVCADGCYVFWRVLEGQGTMRQAIYRMNMTGGKRDRICADCGEPDSASFNGSLVLYENGSSITRIGVLRPASGEHHDLIRHAYHPVRSARLSTDGRWVAFAVDRGQDGRQLFVAPFRESGLIEARDWIPITPPDEIAEEPAWSPGGHWIYYFDRSDGFRCLYARRWDSGAGKPAGDPLWIQHFHSAHRTPMLLIDRDSRYLGLSLSRDRLFLVLSQFDSQIWEAGLPQLAK